MFSKFSNNKLFLVVILLLAFVAVMYFFDAGKNEKSFKSDLVEVDTSAVDEILLYPKDEDYKEVKLSKADSGWFVYLRNGKKAPVPDGKINRLKEQLLTIKPNRLVSRDPLKYNELEVDSTGIRVIVKENGSETLDIIIGKFNFQQPRTMKTYVRLTDDDEVYETDGFLNVTFNRRADLFRNETIMKGNKSNWNSIRFAYGRESDMLVKQDSIWLLNGNVPDSALTENFLNTLQNISSTKFANEFDPAYYGSPGKQVIIKKNDGTEEIISLFDVKPVRAIHSSMNPGSCFEADNNNLADKIFIDPESLIKGEG